MMDYGISYTENYEKKENKYISGACLAFDGNLLICENRNSIKRLYYSNGKKKYNEESIYIKTAVDISAIKEYKGKIYILDKAKKEIIGYENGREETICILPFDYEPLALTVSKYGIAVTALPSSIILISSNTSIIPIRYIKEPIHIEQRKKNYLLVTDSLSHIVYEINLHGEISWSYGVKDYPGCRDNTLFMPMCAIYGEKSIYIAEQRNHRIIEVSYKNKIIKEFGKAQQVGLCNNLLWAPDYVLVDEGKKITYAVLSKAGNIIRISDDSYEVIYGEQIINYSLFNFQRACEWDNISKRLLVADTGHNRIVVMNENGNIEREITEINGVKLESPRYAGWIDEDIIVTDSRNQRIILMDDKYIVQKIFDFSKDGLCKTGNWLQIGMLNKERNKLLVATDQVVREYDTNNGTVIWDSDSLELSLKDVHCAIKCGHDLFITDTGNNRIIVINSLNESINFISSVLDNNVEIKLKSPRMARRIFEGILIVDSGNSKIYVIDDVISRNVTYVHGRGRGLGSNYLSAPRWATCDQSRVFISDTDNHRIVIRSMI